MLNELMRQKHKRDKIQKEVVSMFNELMRQRHKKDKAQMVEYWNAPRGHYNGETKYYKALDEMGRSCYGGYATWSLPTRNADGTWTPGDWMPEVGGILRLCLGR